MFDDRARADFSKARRRAFWQGVRNWFSGKTDELLPFDQVRAAIPIKGQRYRGLQSIPIDQIVGSVGRYHEFNRAFLPTQDHTEDRWVNIGRAQYQQVSLPPIEVYKIGEVYFVQDGNHRVSVARQRDLSYIDAYVTEIDIAVPLTADTRLSDLKTKQETVEFIEKTGITRLFPEAEFEVTLPGEVRRLFEHIDTHRYYLGLEAREEISYEDAVRSWYTEVYLPIVSHIREQNLAEHFPGLTETDLYLLVSEYQWMLRGVYADEASREEADQRFTETLAKISPAAGKPAKRITQALESAPWLDAYILKQEKAEFERATGLDLTATVPGAYSRLVRHIQDHRWYLGIEREREVSWKQAVAAWHENVYLTTRVLIDELDILAYFPNRTETDLYLWIMEHRDRLSESLKWEIPVEVAAESLLGQAQEEAGGGSPGNDGPPSAGETLPLRGVVPGALFTRLLVPFGDDEADLSALDQALVIAERNHGRIYGLHVVSNRDPGDEALHDRLVDEFARRCAARGIPGKAAIDTGRVAQTIARRAVWVDLIVLRLSHPPAGSGLSRMASGFRALLRSAGRPVLAVPGRVTRLRKFLLAYDGSPRADDALFIATCLMTFWENTELVVVTAGKRKKPSAELLARAQRFLDTHQVDATYVRAAEPAAAAILETARQYESDLIIMGSYGNPAIIELARGSTVDAVLQGSDVPVLIRT